MAWIIPKILISCQNCGKEKFLAPWQYERGEKFCTRKCQYAYGSPLKGRKRPEYVCKRISLGQKGRKPTEKQLNAVKAWHKSSEAKEVYKKVGLKLRGRKLTKEHRRKIGEGNKGTIWSIESRKKASESRKALKKHWYCVDCGQEVARKAITRCINCVGAYRSGKNHPNWAGGISDKNKLERQKFQNMLWMKIIKRDGKKCVYCGAEKNLQVDHIKEWAIYPELRFDPNNCRTLCVPCHYKRHYNRDIQIGKRWGNSPFTLTSRKKHI